MHCREVARSLSWAGAKAIPPPQEVGLQRMDPSPVRLQRMEVGARSSEPLRGFRTSS